VFECPICRRHLPSVKAPNGIPRKTCGDKECVKKMKQKTAACSGRVVGVPKVRKKHDKVSEIDLIPLDDLRKAAPSFYALVRTSPIKRRKCLKCLELFSSDGLRVCAACSYSNNQYGARAAL